MILNWYTSVHHSNPITFHYQTCHALVYIYFWRMPQVSFFVNVHIRIWYSPITISLEQMCGGGIHVQGKVYAIKSGFKHLTFHICEILRGKFPAAIPPSDLSLISSPELKTTDNDNILNFEFLVTKFYFYFYQIVQIRSNLFIARKSLIDE